MMRFLSLTATALLLGALGCNDSTAPSAPDINSVAFAASLNVDVSALTKTTEGLYYRDLVDGTGGVVQGSSQIRSFFGGWLPNGTLIDSRQPPATAALFHLGQGTYIGGFEIGLRGMKVGGKRQLVIPPSLGWGSTGSGVVPPNSWVVFVVDPTEIITP